MAQGWLAGILGGGTRVWVNPPYGPHMVKWMQKMAQHRNGIALGII